MKYFMYTCWFDSKHRIHKTLVREFEDRKDLIDMLASAQTHWKNVPDCSVGGKYFYNIYLDGINMCGNDLSVDSTDIYGNAHYVLRPYLFTDNFGRSVDVREWIAEILATTPDPWYRFRRNKKHKRKEQHRKFHCMTGYRTNIRYRHVARARAEHSDPELKQFRRAGADEWLDCGWPEETRRISCCWKDQRKSRRQYKGSTKEKTMKLGQALEPVL